MASTYPVIVKPSGNKACIVKKIELLCYLWSIAIIAACHIECSRCHVTSVVLVLPVKHNAVY